MALIFVMVDGVGLAPLGADNALTGCMPLLERAIGHALTDRLAVHAPSLLAKPIDATLGVPGLPQSGSGHSALYGGFNAARLNGRHQPSYPTIAMRERLKITNLLTSALAMECSVAWANAYLPGYVEAVERRRLRHTAGTWSALCAGLPLRGVPELLVGTAVTWDINQELARERPHAGALPVVDPEAAGARLAALAVEHDLVAYETYLPDLAGHHRIPFGVPEALALVDGLLAGALSAKGAQDTLIVTSDHGNVEDGSTRVHTRNPVPLLAFGPAATVFAAVVAIDGLMEVILHGLRTS